MVDLKLSQDEFESWLKSLPRDRILIPETICYRTTVEIFAKEILNKNYITHDDFIYLEEEINPLYPDYDFDEIFTSERTRFKTPTWIAEWDNVEGNVSSWTKKSAAFWLNLWMKHRESKSAGV